MLRKLIIPVFALGALGACDSGPKTGPSNVPYFDPPPPPPPVDNGVRAPQVINVSMSEDDDLWFSNASGDNPDPATVTHTYVSGGVQYTPTFEDDQLLTVLDSPIDLRGAVFELQYEADSAFVDSGAEIQLLIQERGGWEGYWDCPMATNELLQESAVGIIECELSAETAWANITHEEGVQVGIQAKGSPVGVVTVMSLTVNIPGSGPSGPVVTEISVAEADELWRINPEGREWGYVDAGVQYQPIAEDDQLITDLETPFNMNGAILMFEYIVDADFIASGADLQPIIQEKAGWDGFWGCYIDNADMVADTVGTYECTMPEEDWNITHEEGIQFGIQAKGADEATPPSGTATLTRVRIVVGGPLVTIDADLTEGWVAEPGTLDVDYVDAGARFFPTNNEGGDQFYFVVDGPVDLRGTTFEISFIVDEEYIASGANLQPFVQKFEDGWPGEWCDVANADLTTDEMTATCQFPDGAEFNLQEGERVKAGVVTDGAAAGSVIMTSAVIHLN